MYDNGRKRGALMLTPVSVMVPEPFVTSGVMSTETVPSAPAATGTEMSVTNGGLVAMCNLT